MPRCLPLLALPLLLLLFAGCAEVKPHQREVLAHPAMQQPVWQGIEARRQHVFGVREATRGASGAAAGGCGCN